MLIAVCVDDRNGMAFNGRRLSRDRAQLADLLAFCAGRHLWAGPVSASLLEGSGAEVAADFLDRAGVGDACFVQDRALTSYLDRIEGLLLYRWNRAYPADTWLDLDLAAFELTDRRELAGTSHERITRECYLRKGNYGEA